MTHYNLSLRAGQYQFYSGIYFLLFTSFVVIVCLLLSVWQWQRGVAANERYLLQQKKNQYAAVPLSTHPHEYQKVKLKGSIEAHYLLDNRSKERRPGREILVDVKLAVENPLYDRVLVNIGWQPLAVDLELTHILPEFIAIEGLTKIPREGFMLQDPLLDPSWPSLLQHVDLDLLSDHRGQTYYPAVIYSLTPISGWSLPEVHFKNKYHMHLGYAMQWALIGIACLLLFMKISISKVEDENQQELAA
ncbi:hypothetical protein A9Q81_04105 [Gammaproteobacteria bacterium 42_54_T18]|nr:hypothetical protein A9Q81_04105 [Gammaproteobacteria bacterium 42_54_T18]